MKTPPTILHRFPFTVAAPLAQAPIKRLIHPSAWGSALGTFQLRTQSVVDYLTGTLLKTW
jgi:hypothetical protein